MPLKKSSAAILRWLVCTVAFRPTHRGRVVGGRIVVGDRAADRAAVAHLRVADVLGELRERRDRLLRTSAEPATSAWGVIAPITSWLPGRSRIPLSSA